MSNLLVAAAMALVTLFSVTPPASAQATGGADVPIRLRLAGDSATLPPIRSCLADKLSQMPDVKIATVPSPGVRFIVDIVVAKEPGEKVSAGLVVAQTFPTEEFRPRIKEGEDANALLNTIRYFTLLRLHELLPTQTSDALCKRIADDIRDKVLSKQYTEQND
jgi:hypothetical protein